MDQHHQKSPVLMHVVNLNLPNIQISRNATILQHLPFIAPQTDGFVIHPNAQMQVLEIFISN